MGGGLMRRWEARRLMKTDWTPTTWRRLGAGCKGVRTVIDAALYDHLSRDTRHGWKRYTKIAT